jgi:hypothetical protein
MFATFKTLFVRPAARTPTVRLTVQSLEAREVPAVVGWVRIDPQPEPPAKSIEWVMAGPQPDPPAKIAVSAIAVQSLPPRPAIGALVPPAPGA